MRNIEFENVSHLRRSMLFDVFFPRAYAPRLSIVKRLALIFKYDTQPLFLHIQEAALKYVTKIFLYKERKLAKSFLYKENPDIA